ncbi:MAG: hypothetical protein WCG52_09515, partial [bacterium]
RLYDEKTETWFFSVVDIVQVLPHSLVTSPLGTNTDHRRLDRRVEALFRANIYSVKSTKPMPGPSARHGTRPAVDAD